MCWTVLGLVWGSQFIQNRVMNEAARQGGQFEVFLVQFSLFFAVYVFNVWLSIGQNLALLRLARHEAGPFDAIFRGGRFLLTTSWPGVVFALFCGLIALLGLIWVPILWPPWGGGPLHDPGLRRRNRDRHDRDGLCRCKVLPVPLHDPRPERGGDRFPRLSWEATRGRVGTLILVFMLVFRIILGGLLACLVGILVTGPFTSLMLAVAYLSLTEPADRPDERSSSRSVGRRNDRRKLTGWSGASSGSANARCRPLGLLFSRLPRSSRAIRRPWGSSQSDDPDLGGDDPAVGGDDERGRDAVGREDRRAGDSRVEDRHRPVLVADEPAHGLERPSSVETQTNSISLPLSWVRGEPGDRRHLATQGPHQVAQMLRKTGLALESGERDRLAVQVSSVQS